MIPEAYRPLFALASYNCGPGNVARAPRRRSRAASNPDKWFNNVEIVVARQIGTETTTYVRNIYKFCVAYRFTLDPRPKPRRRASSWRRPRADPR